MSSIWYRIEECAHGIEVYNLPRFLYAPKSPGKYAEHVNVCEHFKL